MPRNIDHDHCFYIHHEKQLIYKTSYIHSLINQNNIKEWLKYFVQTLLHIYHKIEIDSTFFNCDQVTPQLITDDISEHVSIENNLIAQQQTLLRNEDAILHLAPSEQIFPLKIVLNEYTRIEEFSFPTIYSSQFKNYREKITIMQATSELQRSD